jgi:NADH:ubiquinone oxidoreductase subunit C
MNLEKNLLISYANSIILKIPKCIENISIINGKLLLFCDFASINFLLNFLHKHITSQYNVLIDMTVIDKLSKKNRFEIVYFLRTTIFNNILIIKIFNDGYRSVASASSIYSGANWLEREIWDMFGITFSQHCDLRRILTDYGFQGFPLRKDFPLTGFIEVRYDDETKRVIYDSLELSQEFRFFDFQSPWQNVEFNKLN